jgi:hypothetical protein
MAGVQLRASVAGGLGAAKPRLVVERARTGASGAPRRPAGADWDPIEVVLRWEPSARCSRSRGDRRAALGRLG